MRMAGIRAIAGGVASTAVQHRAFPAIVKTGTTVLVAWRAGQHHGTIGDTEANGIIVTARSTDSGTTYAAPATTASDGNYDLRDPALSLLPDGRLALSYFKYQLHSTPATITTASDRVRGVFVRFSSDGGLTWGAEVQITPVMSLTPAIGDPGHAAKGRGKILGRLNGSTLVCPVYQIYVTGGSTLNYRAVTYKSTDNGVTWALDAVIRQVDSPGDSVEPELTVLADGRWMVTGWSDDNSIIWRALSSDQGATWGAPVALTSGGSNITGSSSGTVQLANGSICTLVRLASGGGMVYFTTTSPDVAAGTLGTFQACDGYAGYADLTPYDTGSWLAAFYKDTATNDLADVFVGRLLDAVA